MGNSMIAKLRGLLDETGPNWALLDVGGVFYRVYCSGNTLAHLSKRGETYTLSTEMIVREDSMTLYGFSTAQEQDWFRLLTSVQGVGMKVALALLSALSPDHLYQAIFTGDAKSLTQADGVGPKLAGRVINELKDKLKTGSSNVISLANHGKIGAQDPFQDAISALVNLGYRSFEANQVVVFLKQEGHSGPVEEIIRLALMRLAKVKS
jgi:Holliday junction DNA helicase RuvA